MFLTVKRCIAALIRGNKVNNSYTDHTAEIKLAEQALGGSKEAFCTLYGQYKDKLYRYALYTLKNPEDAEDAVSECVLAAWQGLPGLRNAGAFGAWIFRILRRCCAKRISESVSFRENVPRIYAEGPEHAGDESKGTSDPSVSLELLEALNQLGQDERDIVLLSVLGGLTSREISDLTSLTPGAVRSKLSRSLAKMRDFLS